MCYILASNQNKGIQTHHLMSQVETIGDCYVAVVGLPDPRKDHAVVMSKFARDCLYKFKSKTREMEVELGPDTGAYIQYDVAFDVIEL